MTNRFSDVRSGSRRALVAAGCSFCSFSVLLAAPMKTALAEYTTDSLPGEADPDKLHDWSSGGVYGRFDGDVALGLGLGAELGSNAGEAIAARASAHYFWTAGLVVGYSQALAGELSPDEARRLLYIGADVRPAFIPRWVNNMEQGPALLDLMLDSISLGSGIFFAETEAGFGEQRGFEASLGFGVPLFARASGLWLESRGLLRWVELEQAEPVVLLLLSWQQMVLTPLASRAAERGIAGP
jgi:hypothetical protein